MTSQRPSVNLALRLGRTLLASFTSFPDHTFKAALTIAKCRSEVFGSREVNCEKCGQLVVEANSCRQRFCPLCGPRRANQWLAKWRKKLLPVDHWHIVFTLPHELNILFIRNYKRMGELFLQAVSLTLTTLLKDPQWLGARPGLLVMLQSWDNDLDQHFHVHVLLTSGGADPDGNWLTPKRGPNFLIPHKVISRMFRATFMRLLRAAEYDGRVRPPAGWGFPRRMEFLEAVGKKAFVVHIQGPYAHGVGVLKYLASHVRGGPVPNGKLVSVSSTLVTFRRKPRTNHDHPELTLTLETFLRRWLSHIPETGFHMVRSYGLYSPSNKLKVVGLPKREPREDADPGDKPSLCPQCHLPLIARDRGDSPARRPHAPSRSHGLPVEARAGPGLEVA